MKGEWVLVANPQAGRGRGRRISEQAAAALRAHGQAVSVYLTSGPGDAAALAADPLATLAELHSTFEESTAADWSECERSLAAAEATVKTEVLERRREQIEASEWRPGGGGCGGGGGGGGGSSAQTSPTAAGTLKRRNSATSVRRRADSSASGMQRPQKVLLII